MPSDHTRVTSPVSGTLRTRPAEIAYNAAMAVLGFIAVVLFIAGGSSESLQGLWGVALTALAGVALLFTAHRLLTR